MFISLVSGVDSCIANISVCTSSSVRSQNLLSQPYLPNTNANSFIGGSAVGALLGGIIGHNNSNATGGTQRVCNVQTRYNEEIIEVYSHSVVTFYHNGRQYSLRFQK